MREFRPRCARMVSILHFFIFIGANRIERRGEGTPPYGNIYLHVLPVETVCNNVQTSCATRLCRACVELTVCVAVRYPITANISRNKRNDNPTAVSYFRSGRRSLVCARLSNKGRWSPKRIETLVFILLDHALTAAHILELYKRRCLSFWFAGETATFSRSKVGICA